MSGGGLYEHLQEGAHDFVLEVVLARYLEQLLGKVAVVDVGEHVAYGVLKARLLNQGGDFFAILGVVVWRYVFELFGDSYGRFGR